MKKLIGAALFLVACHRSPPMSPPFPGTPGAATAREAVTTFLNSVKAEDLQGISSVWGTSAGLARETMPLKDLEEREFVMMKCLKHDRYTVVSDAAGTGGYRVVSVALTKGTTTRNAEFSTIPGPNGRWFFEKMDVKTCPLIP